MRDFINIVENAQPSSTETMLWSLIEFEYMGEGDQTKVRDIAQHARALITIFLRRGFRFEWGSTRITFIGERYVYKVPRDFSGVRANQREAKYYRSPDKKFPVAACRIVTLGTDVELPILVMEKVLPIGMGAIKPDWADYHVDNGQVGKNRRGDVVAYDL